MGKGNINMNNEGEKLKELVNKFYNPILHLRVWKFVNEQHANQTDKAGENYIWHLVRVAHRLKDKGESYWMAGLLHDVLEDTPTTPEELLKLGVYQEVVDAVRLVSKNYNKGDYFEAYLSNINKNEIARQVKLADFTDNMNLGRLPEIGEADIRRQDKYVKGYSYLAGY